MLILRSIGYRFLELPSKLGKLPQSMSLLRTILGALAVATVVGGVFFMTTRATNVNVLANGNFENGFHMETGCGMVGNNWGCFNNGGDAEYGFYDEQWTPVVADGAHGQLIEINTNNRPVPDHDRFAGIYQTVNVPAQSTCTISMRGMIRTTKHGGDPWRYRVQVGTSHSADWNGVTNWVDAGWDTYHDRLSPGAFDSFSHSFTTSSSSQTVFIRFWKKWGIPEEEILLNLDGVALTCPAGGHAPATATAYVYPTAYAYPTATAYVPHYPTPTPYHYPTAVVYPTAVPVYPTAVPVYPTAVPVQSHGCSHIVKPGESLGWIAQDYGLTLHQLINANAIQNADWIYVGQKLYIPICSGYNPAPVHPTAVPVVPTATHVPPTATHVPATATHVPPTAVPATATTEPVACAGYYEHDGICYPEPWNGEPQYGCFITVDGPTICIDPPASTATPTAVVTAANTAVATNTPYVIVVTATPTAEACKCDDEDIALVAPTATIHVEPTATPMPATATPHVVPTATPHVEPTVTPAMYRTFTVKYGNTLSHVAQHYGVSMSALMHLNGIYDADQIYIGQVLLIPNR